MSRFRFPDFPDFPEFWESTIIHERLAGEVGNPSRLSRKGKEGSSEAGRSKHSPSASPERVTSEALKRRGSGVYRDETPETPH